MSFSRPEAVRFPTQFKASPDTEAIDKDMLFEQILACDPGVSGALAAVREEIESNKLSMSGIEWQSRQISTNVWNDFAWDTRPRTIFVARYSLAQATSDELQIWFEWTATQIQFHIDMDVTAVEFWLVGGGHLNKYHTFKLSHSMLAVGDHSVALVNDGGQIRVFFDYKESTLLPRVTTVSRLDKVFVRQAARGRTVEVEVYVFD